MLEHTTPLKIYYDELKDPAASNKLMQIIDSLQENQCILLKPSEQSFLRTQLIYEIVNKNFNELNEKDSAFQNNIEQIKFTPEFHRIKMLEIEQNVLHLLPMEKASYIHYKGGEFVTGSIIKEGYITDMIQEYYEKNVHYKYVVYCVTKRWKVR